MSYLTFLRRYDSDCTVIIVCGKMHKYIKMKGFKLAQEFVSHENNVYSRFNVVATAMVRTD